MQGGTSVDADLPELGEVCGGATTVLVAVVEGALDLRGEAELQPPHSLFQQVTLAGRKKITLDRAGRTQYSAIQEFLLLSVHIYPLNKIKLNS